MYGNYLPLDIIFQSCEPAIIENLTDIQIQSLCIENAQDDKLISNLIFIATDYAGWYHIYTIDGHEAIYRTDKSNSTGIKLIRSCSFISFKNSFSLYLVTGR